MKKKTDLVVRLGGRVVSLGAGLGVAGSGDQGDVDVNVVAVLDAPDDLLQLVVKVLPTCFRHHEVVLHGDRETASDGVGSKAPLGLCQRTSSRFVRDPGRGYGRLSLRSENARAWCMATITKDGISRRKHVGKYLEARASSKLHACHLIFWSTLVMYLYGRMTLVKGELEVSVIRPSIRSVR